jgi:endonuclease/exonuclease/phosphatase (EEP) superfamily protein YafD
MASAVVGIGLLIVAVAALVARYVAIPNHGTLYVVIASPFLMAAAPLALLAFLWGRRRIGAVVAACVSVALIASQLPWFLASTPCRDAVALRAMTINMLYGRADPQSIVAIATAEADVLLVQEFTPRAEQRLAAAGVEKTFPYQELDTRPGAAGVGIYSRYPISDAARIGGFRLAMVRAQIRVPRVARDVTLLSLHLDAPWPRPIDGWHHDLDRLPGTLDDVATKAGGGAVLVGGDFNSTIDMRPFRQLLTNGYDDAVWQAGSGRTFTYPANKWYPPLLGIDHFLTRDCTATSTKTITVTGSDHRALLATVLIPRT